MIAVRDLAGRVVCYLDGDLSTPRDVNGKPVGERAAGRDAQSVTLADKAAALMRGERLVKMDLGPADVVQPATQATYGIPAACDYVADMVSPVRFVKQFTGYWYVEDVNDALRLVIDGTGSSGQPAELMPGFSKTKFTTKGYALSVKLPRQLSENADFDLKEKAVCRLADGLRRLREARVASLLTTSGNWAAGNRVAAVAKWNASVGNPAPLTDLFAALVASAIPANTLVLPENVAQYFHWTNGGTGAQIRDFVQGGGQLPCVLYARAKSMVGGVPAYIWAPTTPANVPLVRAMVDPDQDIPSSVTFRWLGESPDGERRDGILVRQFYSSADDSDWIVCLHDDVEVQPSNAVGAVITGALA